MEIPRSLARLWPLVGALCLSPLAQAAQQRSGSIGYQCLLANGAKFFAMLVAVEGLSYKEAAQVLCVPLGTVMSRLARARLAIGKRVSDAPADRMS